MSETAEQPVTWEYRVLYETGFQLGASLTKLAHDGWEPILFHVGWDRRPPEAGQVELGGPDIAFEAALLRRPVR